MELDMAALPTGTAPEKLDRLEAVIRQEQSALVFLALARQTIHMGKRVWRMMGASINSTACEVERRQGLRMWNWLRLLGRGLAVETSSTLPLRAMSSPPRQILFLE